MLLALPFRRASAAPILLLAPLLLVASAASGQPLSASGTATIDGVLSGGEWDAADTRSIFAGALTGSTLYVMNDGVNLYVAIEVVGDADLGANDIVALRFDNDLDLVPTQNDDAANLNNAAYSDKFFDAGISSWANNDSVQHGQGGVARSGGVNFFEFGKPLSSGDSQDFDLGPGDPVGICVMHFVNGTASSTTVHPANCNLAAQQQGLYDEIEITAVLSATDSGRYTSAGFHNPAVTDYRAIVGGTRNFFVFDLSALPASRVIASATLHLDVGVVTQGGFGGISYVLHDVSTPVAALVAGGSGLVGTYNDLGSGTALSDVISIAPEDQGTVRSISLLPAGVAALQAARGGLIALGGDPSGLGGNQAFSGTDLSGVQLAIELAPLALPSISVTGLGVLVLLILSVAGWVLVDRPGVARS